MYVCMSVTLPQIDSSSLFLDGIEPFLGCQFSMRKATKRCCSNFDLLPWQRNSGYFCKNFKLLLLFCLSMESSHFWPLVLRDPLYKTLFFDFYPLDAMLERVFLSEHRVWMAVWLAVCLVVCHSRYCIKTEIAIAS